MAGAVLLAILVVAGAFGSEKVEKVPAASGTVQKTRWHVGFFRSKHGEFCSWIATEPTVPGSNPVEAGGTSGAVCGAWEAPGIWKPEQGVVEKGFTISLFLTGLDVARVRLKVKQRGGGSKIRSFRTKRLGATQAGRSQVRRDFRYVVLTGHGDLCVIGVTAYGFKGKPLGQQRSFCEI
jgi:hypothetical protein